MSANRPPRDDAGHRRLLRCDSCGRSVWCDPADLLRFTRQGWPKCCGQTMPLFSETGKPAAGDTVTDAPPLPPERPA